jgi:hypothetical protein
MAKLTEIDPVVSVASGSLFYLVDGGDSQSHSATIEALTTKVLAGLTGPLSIAGPLDVSASGLTGAFQSTHTGTGSTGGTQHYFNYNNITAEDIDAGDNLATSYVIGSLVNHAFGGTDAHGGRFCSFDALTLVDETSATTGVRWYVASGGQSQANVSDGGTIGGSNEKGRVYGGSHNAALASTATGFEQLSARYDYVTMTTGTSAKTKIIQQLIYEAQDREQGSTYDAALGISSESASCPGGVYGILIGDFAGAAPLDTGGTIMGTTGAGTVANGVDLSGYTVVNDAFKSNGFAVDGTGNISGAALTTSAILTTVPTTLTGTSGTVNSLSQIINPSNTFTLTLIDPTAAAGRWQYVKTIAAFAVNSASSNVVPLTDTGSGTAILTNTDGKWAWLQSDGTNWIVMSAN